MKIIVCGGRDYSNQAFLEEWLDRLNQSGQVSAVIHGGASGADTRAGVWAKKRGVPVRVFPADWKAHGKAAGPRRNARMLEERPDAVVAFPGGRGTDDMVRQATRAGVRVLFA